MKKPAHLSGLFWPGSVVANHIIFRWFSRSGLSRDVLLGVADDTVLLKYLQLIVHSCHGVIDFHTFWQMFVQVSCAERAFAK